MKANRNTIILSILTAVLIIIAFGAEKAYFSGFEYRLRTKMFNKTLVAKETVMDYCLNAMKPLLAKESPYDTISRNDLFKIAEKNRITLLEYVDNKPWYWSDNEFDVPHDYIDSLYNKPLVFLQNGWFLIKSVQSGNEKIIGLLRLHTDYGFENNILKNGFEKEFRIPGNVDLDTDKNASGFHIFDKKGDFLFSLMYPPVKGNTSFIFIPLCLWAGVFVLIILLTFGLVKILMSYGKALTGSGLTLIIFASLYTIVLFSGKPQSVFLTELFSPYRFYLNRFIPSLGHLLMLGILGSAFSTVLLGHLSIKSRTESNGASNYVYLTGLLIVGALILCLYQWIFSKVISTSNINFETYKVLDLNIFSIAGFASVFLLLLVPVFYLFKVFQSIRDFSNGKVAISIIISLSVPMIFYINRPATLFPLTIFYCILVLSIWISTNKNLGLFTITVILLSLIHI